MLEPIRAAESAPQDEQLRAARGPFDRTRPSQMARLRPTVLAAIFVGGCAGGLARDELTRAWPTATGGFPWATFAINTCGAFLLAVLLVLMSDVLPPTTYVRPLLGTGFCGAWTTFSSITAGADQLIAHGAPSLGAAYVLASALAGLGSAALGLMLARAFAMRRHQYDAAGRAG